MNGWLKFVDTKGARGAGSWQDLILLVRKHPLRKRSLVDLARKLHLKAADAARVACVSLRTYQRKSDKELLSPLASESVLKIGEVYETGMEVFDGDEEAFVQWLSTPIPALKYIIPLELALSPLGANLVLDELKRIDCGIVA